MFLLQEIRGVDTDTGDAYPIVGLYWDAPDLVVLIPEAALAALTLEVYRVRNVPYGAGPRIKIEMRGSVSSFDEDGTSQEDGWVELRINCRPYQDGDDFATIDPASEPTKCEHGKTGLDMWNFTGWRIGVWDYTDQLDCVYLSEFSNYCREQPQTGTPGECDPPGPGGASFDGGASGPLRTRAGGFPAVYAAFTGGGIPATAADVVDPQTLAAIVVPVVSFDLTLCDASVVRYAKTIITWPALDPPRDTVTRWGDIPYPLSDRFGNVQAQTWEVSIADPSGELRGWLASGTNRFYKRWTGQLYLEDDTKRQAGTARRAVARGRCITVRTDEDFVVTLVFSDELSRHDSPYSLDRELPHVGIGEVYGVDLTGPSGLRCTAAPEDHVAEQPLPLLFGEPSDEYRSAENPPTTPIGVHKLRDVGDFLLNGSEAWMGFAVCLYACQAITAIFGSDQHPDCPASVRLDPNDNTFLIPGWGDWDSYFTTRHLDLVRGGVTYRVTMLFGKGPVARAHREGKVPLSVNVRGCETVGDSTGDLIDDAAYIVQLLLDHPILRSTTTGEWGAVATFADGVAKIKTTDFAAVVAVHAARLSARYRAGVILDERRAARDWLAQILVSADMRLGTSNHHGQITARTFNDAANITTIPRYTAVEHLRADSFKLGSELNAELENKVEYEYGPEPAAGRMLGVRRPLAAPQSIANWGDVYKAEPITFVAIYRPEVGADVAARRLIATQDGITRGVFTIDLQGGDLDTQIVALTHRAGLGTTGWTDRLLLATDRTLHVNEEGDLAATIAWEDLQAALVQADGTTPRVGFRPLRTDGSGTLLGSTAAGTGSRLG